MQRRRGTFVRTPRSERLTAPRRGSYFSRLQALLGGGLSVALLGGMLAASFAFPAQATGGGDGGGTGVCTIDNGVTTYVGGNLASGAAASEIEGVTVVKGNADVTYLSNVGYLGAGAGAGSSLGQPGDRVLSVGGTLSHAKSGGTLVNATAVNGNGGAIAGGAINDNGRITASPKQGNVGFAAAVGSGSPYDDFTTSNNLVSQASAGYKALAANGTASVDPYSGEVTLKGSGSAPTQVFSVNGSLLAGNKAIKFTNIPSGATMVVNISGASPTLAMQGGIYVNGTQFSLHGANAGYVASHIVWNFHEGTTVSLKGQDQLPGMILVPSSSSTTTVSTHLNGRVFVNGNLNFGTAGGSGLEIHSFSAVGFPCQPPAPSKDGAQIVVHKGGDRIDSSTVAGLAGASFAAYPGTRSSLPSPLPEAADTCVTGADGTCTLDVEARSGKGKYDSDDETKGYWIVETGAPEAFSEVGSVGTGVYSSDKFVTPYRYFVEAPAKSTRNVPADGLVYEKSGSKKGFFNDTSGTWADVRDNGEFPKVCGVSIAVVFDVSNSVSSDELKQFKKAAKSFVDDGLGETPSTVTMFKFASTAKKISDAISLASSGGVDDAKGVVDQVGSSGVGSYTNWDAALQLVSSSGSYDLVLFLTDGDPTTYGDGTAYGSDVFVKNLDEAIFSANQLKAKTGPAGKPTMILPVGIGLSGNSDLNLKAISGPKQGEDYFLAADFASLETTLKQIATANCGGSVTVTKKIADPDGRIVDDSAAGWDFTGSGPGVTTATKRTDATGTVNFKVDFGSTPTGTKSVTIVETQQDGYALKQDGAKNAVCYDENDDKVAIGNSGALGFVVPVGAKQKINCVVVNQQAKPHWTIEKSADRTVVQPGGTITYTLTARNDSKSPVANATATDVLVEGAAYADGAPVFAPGSGLAYDAGTKRLTWSIGALAANGGTATVQYGVKVKADAWGVAIKNEVTPGTDGDCVSGKCTTTTTTPDHWTLRKTSDPATGSQVLPGGTIEYTLVVTNDSKRDLANLVVKDDLTQVLAHADPSGTWSTGLTRNGDTLTWAIPSVKAGKTATATYQVTVKADAWGVTLVNAATPQSPGGVCVTVGGCTTTHETPVHWTIVKTSDHADGKVQPGATLTYTLTASNSTGKAITGATATDALAGVLQHATLSEPLASGLSLDPATKLLTWSLPTIPAHGSVQVSYTVTVGADAWGVTLVNLVTPGTNGECEAAADCTTTHQTPGRWTLEKSSDPASGSQVRPGDPITYTLTAKNASGKAITGATAIDDLSAVLANATVTHLGAGLAYDPSDATRLVWSLPDLAKGATATVSYTVVVKADAWGVSFANVVTPTGEGTCIAAADCTTSHRTPGYWVIVKKANPASGSTVQPGASITYTLEATNRSKSTISGATAVDELKDVLAHAQLTSHDADLTPSGTQLRWALPTMTPGQTVSTEYTVTVDSDAWGIDLENLVTPGTDGHCATDADCTTTHVTPGHWTIAKTSDPVSGSTVQPGTVVTYTLRVHNDSGATITGQSAVDDLSAVLDHASLTSYDSTQLTRTGTSLTWSIPDVKPGGYAQVSYQVTIDSKAWGTTLRNVVTPNGDGICVLDADCTTTHRTPGNWTIEKSSDPASGAEVQPGASITYTLKVHNKAVSTLTGATAVDDLSSVLANAQVTSLGAGLAYDAGDPTKLVWSVPAVEAGKDATVSYTVTVNADAWGVALRNHVTPTGDGHCVEKPGDPCDTTHTTPGHWTLKKTSQGSNGSPVRPGDTVTYTLTAHNDSARDLSGLTATDDVSGISAHVAIGTLPAGLKQTAPDTITWTIGALGAGKTATISYTAVVNADAWGVTLTNLVTPGDDGHCVTDADCTTTDETPDRWVLEKSSDPASGSTVEPGTQIRYTLTARNLSAKAISGATAIDELKDVLPHGQVTRYGTGLASSGTTLVWSIPTMQPHGTVTVDYVVTVDDDAWGVTLRNVVTPGTDGVCETDASCTTTHGTPPHFTLVKTSDPASGSVVMPGTRVTYTLTAHNDSAATVSNGTAEDNLADILDDGSLVTPLDPALTRSGTTLTWAIPALAPGGTAHVSYTVLVKADAWSASLVNVVTPGDNGECVEEADCTTDNHTPDVNLGIVKSHDEIDGGAVDSGKGDTIPYRLVVTNHGKDAATGVTVTDELPAGLTVVPGSESLPGADWTFTVTDGTRITVTKSGSFGVDDTATITFDALVGALDRSGTDQPYPDIDNEACVSSTEQDSDMSDNCSTDTTPTKSIAVSAHAVCLLNAPYVQYSLTPYNVSQAPTIAIVWWTQDAYDHRDPSIDASDEAAILADGASKVDYVTLPSGWKNGEPITGKQLWPGAAVDANGNGVAWPGWRQLPTGQWVLDPGSQFYQLRTGAVIEVRINPTTAVATSYPTEDCVPKPEFAGLVNTGSDLTGPMAWGGGMLALGLMALLGMAWARKRQTGGSDVS